MDQTKLKETIQKVINKEKWWDILSRFIDVLHINIFIIDSEGRVVLPPEEGKYGGGFLTNPKLGFDVVMSAPNIIQKFKNNGIYLEYVNKYGLSAYAIPINIETKNTIAYMIVGPLILNRKMDIQRYEELVKESGINANEFLNQISEIRVVSNIMLNSILDLLSEIIKDNVELSLRGKFIKRVEEDEALNEINKVAQEIYSSVRLDELLVTLLDVALKMTDSECGSIMVADEKNKDLAVKVSRGLKDEHTVETRVKMENSIAGIAFRDNSAFFINGQQGDNRIKHLLKRPEIKQALVIPLMSKDRIIGVLNLHTKKEESKIKDNFDNLQYLTKLLSSVF
jgi:hypothetical protein